MSGSFEHQLEDAEETVGQPVDIRPSVAAPEEYPIDQLCPLMKAAALAIMDKVQVPAAIAGQAVLCAGALAVQMHVDVELPTGETRPTSLFAATVAASGERKSATDGWALEAVRAVEAEMRKTWSNAQSRFVVEKAAYEAAVRSAKSGAGKKSRAELEAQLHACGQEPRPPIYPVLICEEPTMQALQKAYQDAMPGLGLFSDEGAQFIGGHSMGDDNRAATGAALSKLWDGAPIKRMRAGEPLLILPGRRLSVHLMFQPGVARKLFGSKELKDQGLLSRILCCHPTSLKGTRMWRDASTDSRLDLERFGSRVATLLCGDIPMDPETRELKPAVLRLSDEARSLAIAWYEAVERAQLKGGPFEQISGFAGKLFEHSIRLAAVMSFFQNKDASIPISGLSMAAGVELAKFYAGEALRLFGVGEADEDTDNAAAIIEWIRENGLRAVGARMLGRHGPGRTLTGPQVKRAIAVMVDLGHLKEIKGGGIVEYAGKAERNREAYAVIPDGGA